jgi:P27 family predicted phage terminase small subunit
MKGRKPTPTLVKKWTGNPSRTPIAHDPKVADGELKCPARLKGEARKMWRRIVQSWAGAGILKPLDAGTLEAYCCAYARFVSAEAIIAKTGTVVRNGSGASKNPACTVIAEATSQMQRFGSDMGLSPVARVRLAASDAEAGDDFDEFAHVGKHAG